MKKWYVYYGAKVIDVVYFTPDCDASYVTKSLIEHDGYPISIYVM